MSHSHAAPPDVVGHDPGHFRKTLTWRDGFALAMVIPNGLFVTFGYLLGAVGAWTAITIWVVATAVSVAQNVIFSEMAAMFSGKSGGVARYAIEGWRKYFVPVDAIASFGYWMGWSLSLSVTAVSLGCQVSLIESGRVPLVRALGQAMGVHCAALHESRGVSVLTSGRVIGFTAGCRVTGVVLDDGVLPVDLVVVGIGAIPNTD